MKIMFICKKHYKQLMKEFKTMNPPEAVDGVLKNSNASYLLHGIGGIDFRIEIKPYLKKIKILDTGKFEMRMPVEEDIAPPRRLSRLSGIDWS